VQVSVLFSTMKGRSEARVAPKYFANLSRRRRCLGKSSRYFKHHSTASTSMKSRTVHAVKTDSFLIS
jgi:hypothetical protein